MMFTVGLTGDVGAGKSTLLSVWRELGASVISTDVIAKEQWGRPEVLSAAVRRWGGSIVSGGAPDYAAIADFAFSSREEFEFTNSLIHPLTREAVERELASLRGWVVIEIPLLFEGGLRHLIDCIVYVTAEQTRRIMRNLVRGWDDAEIIRRERFLMSRGDKMKMSNLVLCNNGDMEQWLKTAREWGSIFMQIGQAVEHQGLNPKQNSQPLFNFCREMPKEPQG